MQVGLPQKALQPQTEVYALALLQIAVTHCCNRQVHSRVKMSCRIKLNSESLVINKASKSQTVSPLWCMSKSCNRSKSRLKRKTCVTHVAKCVGDRRGQSKVKARAAGCDPQPAAANTGQVPTGTRSIPTGLSSKVHFSCVVCLRLVSQLITSKHVKLLAIDCS